MRTTPRERAERREEQALLGFAARSGPAHLRRERPEERCSARTAFEVDAQRVVHSKAFRRLKGKTQVFLWPEGDHYRTRLTHCLEVSEIARTLARALALNEHLTEAIALGHDLGHTPFGHAGEEAMQRLVPGGFRHERQSLRVVEKLENDGAGLNLTEAVRDGILRHSKGAGPAIDAADGELPRTLEGQLVRLADCIAYVNHDLDDALRARIVAAEDVPRSILAALGETEDERLTRIILDVVESTDFEARPHISMSQGAAEAFASLRTFLYENVYYNPKVHAEFDKASALLERLFDHFVADLDRFYADYWPSALRDGGPVDDVRDFLAGMTDAFAVNLHERIFTPRRWFVF